MAVLDHITKDPDEQILESPPVFKTISQLILLVSFITATVVIQAPHEYINGARIPTLLFKCRPSTFYAFIISIILAFSTAFSALIMFRQLENIARITGYCSLINFHGFSYGSADVGHLLVKHNCLEQEEGTST
ncbi:hypothetical protein M0R45_005560 [Rubus argutus]|uniref:PGG domain-containing protein n=1 Tax=Rubus argutus TaxID=59490 RepID=A0AAW1YN93_RUBAR